MKMRIPVLERERFIADTLYKKLWIHDLCHVHNGRGFFVLILLVCYRMLLEKLSWKVLGNILQGVFLCLAEAMKKV